MNRAMDYVNTPFVVFTDANTQLNEDALVTILNPFQDETVGAVAGEKRVNSGPGTNLASKGEGLYWKYESFLKKLDAKIYSVVGAAGELFAIRTTQYAPLEKDSILDDFMLSMRVTQKGYRVMYAPDACAIESGSSELKEEWKRKVRICAGGFQSMSRLLDLLNPFKFGVLSFQFISHRVLRWTLAPLCLILIFLLSLLLATSHPVYASLFYVQILFYATAVTGWAGRRSKQINGPVLIPLYFSMMNLAAFAGFFRFLTGKQSARWERSKRANYELLTPAHDAPISMD